MREGDHLYRRGVGIHVFRVDGELCLLIDTRRRGRKQAATSPGGWSPGRLCFGKAGDSGAGPDLVLTASAQQGPADLLCAAPTGDGSPDTMNGSWKVRARSRVQCPSRSRWGASSLASHARRQSVDVRRPAGEGAVRPFPGRVAPLHAESSRILSREGSRHVTTTDQRSRATRPGPCPAGPAPTHATTSGDVLSTVQHGLRALEVIAAEEACRRRSLPGASASRPRRRTIS